MSTSTAAPPSMHHLAARWTPGAAADAGLAAETRAALLSVRPGDRAAVEPLVQALVAVVDDPALGDGARASLYGLFDQVRRRPFTESLHADEVDPWVALLMPAVERSDFTLGQVLLSREATDPRTMAMRVLGPEGSDLTVADLARRTRALARGLLALRPDEPDLKVAILAENSLDTALTDLACLTNGIVDFPLPANSTPEQVTFMLRHSGAHVLVVSDEEQLEKVLPSLPGLPDLKDVVVVSQAAADRHGLVSLEQAVSQSAGAFDDAVRASRASRVRSRGMATAMYTSGTTGRPKAIVFDQLNIVSKRMCRGFALPRVNEGDVFLCYLPLYHTFGRWLEMTGSLWWGGTYVFARSTAHASLVEDFRHVQPTVFISVPKKWMEFQETAQRYAGSDDPDLLTGQLRSLTGGRLAHGLSAAGYLDPVVFRSFHRAGVELCSGYGMTEATGGITMTPPGEYVDGSIGKPLPGIECRRADDGELLIRGPYVSPGYYRPESDDGSHDAEGWFHTGDLVSIDAAGHFRITGRKKEIYKNRAGQTIAPQRVENLFRDFDDVAQAFLVGDHREYNTLLVWPNYEARPELRGRSPDELQKLISSYVISANRFLAPFERVVSFRVLDRPLDEAHGELTHKNTFKRDVVEKNWRPLIDEMYEHRALTVNVGSLALRIPNWVLRELGVLVQDVVIREGRLHAGDRSLQVGVDPRAPGSVRIGDLAYRSEAGLVDLGSVLAHPTLWLGNDGLRRFLGEEAFRTLAVRRPKGAGEVTLDPRVWVMPDPERLPALLQLVGSDVPTVESVHAAGELLRAERSDARRALAHLERVLQGGQRELVTLARGLLRRSADSPEEEVRRRAFRDIIPHEEPGRIVDTLGKFLDRLGPRALTEEDLAQFGERGLTEPQVEALLATLQAPEALDADIDNHQRRLLSGAMRLITAFGLVHPHWYGRVRVPLARLTFHPNHLTAARASEEYDRLRRGFQHWVGPNLRVAFDPQTGDEYSWREVVRFDDGIPQRSRDLLLRTLADSTLVRSSVFILGNGKLVSLADIAPGGAAVSLLGSRLGKSVYRLTITTRSRETFEAALNHAETMPPAELRDEVMWLLSSGAPPPLVERFGSYHPDWGIYTEEFIPGENVEQQLSRIAPLGRHKTQWPFLVWTAMAAHVGFWDRTGRRVALREPSPAAFIVPSHDYQTGGRLVSVSDRIECGHIEDVLDRFEATFVNPTQERYPELRGLLGGEVRASALVEAIGLERAVAAMKTMRPGPRQDRALGFLKMLDTQGYTPRQPYFAAARFRRWLAVNPEATEEAQGTMLGDLWTTYQLGESERQWPDTRIRFFRQTVFADAREPLASALDRLMARARALPYLGLDLRDQLAALREAVKPDAREDYFLARMTFRHLRPGDDTSLISLERGDHVTTEVVVGATDSAGERFFIRAARTPREAARLLQLFREAGLDVTFGPEHRQLLAVDAHDGVIGGVYYRPVTPELTFMEKIAVARRYRGRGVADGIMREFERRQRARGVKAIQTGWLQPELLRRFGFRTDPASGGLLLDLVAAAGVPL